MRAIILAAGRGTRLAPYTNDRPKCLVKLAGKSMLSRQLAVLNSAGIADVILVGGYRADQLKPYASNIILNTDYASTNMVHSLFCAQSIMDGSDDILIAYSDIVYEDRVLQSLLNGPAGISCAVNTQWRALWQARMENPLSDAESLRMASDGRLLEIGRKATDYNQIEGQYMGLIKISAEQAPLLQKVYDDMAHLPRYGGAAHSRMYLTDFLQRLCDLSWPIHGVRVDGGWLEVDSVEDLQIYQNLINCRQLDRFCKLA